MGSGFSKMKKQAKLFQQQMETVQEELKNKEVVGESGGGLVKVILSGEKELKKIHIDQSCLGDREALEDLIFLAHKEAFAKLKEDKSALSFPGF